MLDNPSGARIILIRDEYCLFCAGWYAFLLCSYSVAADNTDCYRIGSRGTYVRKTDKAANTCIIRNT